MKKIKVLLAALLVFSLSNVYTSFANSQEPVEITFWHAMNGPHQEALAKLVEAFNQSQDQYKVVEQNQGDYASLQQSIIASGVSKDLPVMAQLTASTVVDFKDQGLTMPLDEHLTSENGFTQELRDDIFEGFLTGVTFDDQIYALPFSKSVRMMYVNQDILDEVGAEIPKTWAEVLELGKALDEAGIEAQAMGLENGPSMELETMAKQNGATWIADDKSTTDIASDKAVETLQFLKDLIKEDHARIAGEDGYMSGPFSQGATALYIGSSAGLPHVLPGVEESGMKMVTAELPVYGEGEPLTLFAGNDLGIFASASDEQIAGAIQFMSFLLQADNTAQWAKDTGYLPITKSGVESKIWQDFLADVPYVEAATKELTYGKSQVPYVGASEVFTELNTAIENVFINDSDPATELKNIEDLVKGHLGL
ncbi:ABC transporter substrate-binding protein [Facklamia miroungae]|uniref:Multiple sugar transport system substrate-binding protein n=1 Tax=Facklamia miroungae TaxID=120956 RepID=A0A1G7V2D3_9LACT|nr:ABC transporter substrate-binding protein [Facklamia miroungae]NKZ30240.1 ABC transporter substrate-binding protein [Facklamia miroungae]SDG53916.1 multiple sugar transport system substrate-binding protein [Facklamia miroungae]